MRLLNRTTMAVLAGVWLAACQGSSREPVRIAVAFPTRNAVVAQVAIDELNAQGGIGGAPIVLVRDTIPSTVEPADVEIRRAEGIAAQRPLAVIGHGGSRGSLAAAPVYNQARIVHIVPTGTSRDLARAGPWTFALPPNDSVEGAFIARFLKERLRARRVAVFYVNDEYGIGLRDGLRAALAPDVPVRELRIDVDSDLGLLADLVRRDRADAVVAAVRAVTAGGIVRRLGEAGLPVPVVVGDGAVALPDLAELAGPSAEGRLYAATFWLPTAADSASRRFTALIRSRLGRRAVASDALVYDAVRLVAAAVGEAGREPEALRRHVAALGVGAPPYRGVSGPLGFGAARPPLVMGVMRSGDLVPVEPPF